MASFDIDGILDLMAATALVLAALAWSGSLAAGSPRHQERPFAILTPQAAPLAHAARDPVEERSPAPAPGVGE